MTPQHAIRGVLWLVVLTLAAAVLLWARQQIDQSQVVLTMLLVVVGASVAGGRVFGLTAAAISFVLIDYYFQAPYDQLSVGKSLDWVVLVAFVATAFAVTDLLARARWEAELARARTAELTALSRLGADTLRFADSADALRRIATLTKSALEARATGIRAIDDQGAQEIEWYTDSTEPQFDANDQQFAQQAAEARSIMMRHRSGEVSTRDPERFTEEQRVEEAVELLAIPLISEARPLGALMVAGNPALRLDPARRRFLVTLAYYAALAVDRMHLMAEADRLRAHRDANRAKDEILAAVSHDLRTPLTSIRVLAQDDDIAAHPSAIGIVEQTDRMTRMVSDVLDLSRLRAGAYSITPEVNTAEDVIGAALRQVRGRLGARKVAVRVNMTTPVVAGRFDFAQTLRILGNLLDNAIRHSPRDGTVEIHAYRDAQSICFVVSDQGAGVPASEVDRIFEAFYRPRNQAPDVGHAGLGLSIARTLAELQGGSLTFRPRQTGGSEFVVRLPGADAVVEAEDELP